MRVYLCVSEYLYLRLELDQLSEHHTKALSTRGVNATDCVCVAFVWRRRLAQ